MQADQSKTGSTQPIIFATSVSKYVFKKGRLTIPPERILRASGLLKHDDDNGVRGKDMDRPIDGHKSASDSAVPEHIELERLKGMVYAKSWNRLDSLHEQLLKEDEISKGVLAIDHVSDISLPWRQPPTV